MVPATLAEVLRAPAHRDRPPMSPPRLRGCAQGIVPHHVPQGARKLDRQTRVVAARHQHAGLAFFGAIALGDIPEEWGEAGVPGARHGGGQRVALAKRKMPCLALARDRIAGNHILEARNPELNAGHPVGRVVFYD